MDNRHMVEAVREYLEARQDKMVSMLGDLVMLESYSSEKAAVDGLSGFLAAEFSGLGLEVEHLPRKECGDLLRISYGKGEPQVLVLGHMDTVWPLGEAAKRPFRVIDGKAWGPGVNDMKGGLTQGFWAIKALLAHDWRPRGRVVFLLNSDEETGSHHSRKAIVDQARKSTAVLVLEPANPAGAVKTRRKGIMRLNLEVRGQPGHAGNVLNEGVSAIEEMAHQVLYLQGLSDPKTETSVNVNWAEGGVHCASVPSLARAEVDLRYWEPPDRLALRRAVEAMKPFLDGAKISCELSDQRPAMTRNPENRKLFSLAKEIARKIGWDLSEAAVHGGSDGCITSAAGIPTLDGLGSVGGLGHTLDEHVIIEQMAPRAALAAGLLHRLLG